MNKKAQFDFELNPLAGGAALLAATFSLGMLIFSQRMSPDFHVSIFTLILTPIVTLVLSYIAFSFIWRD